MIQDVSIAGLNHNCPISMKRNIFDEPVSVFAGNLYTLETRHYVRTIGQFLAAGRGNLYAAQVKQLRAYRAAALDAAARGDMQDYERLMERYKKGKVKLPFAMMQGVCPTRKQTGFTSYSRVLCIDIDAPKPTDSKPANTWVSDWVEIKRQLSALPFVAYCALSIGGAGVFALVPIADERYHGEYFDALAALILAHFDLTVDPATRNINRLRLMTWDPDAFLNPDALVWDRLLPSQVKRHTDRYSWAAAAPTRGTCQLTPRQRQVVRDAVIYCVDHGINLVDNRDAWIKVGGFFAHNYLDDEGQILFHALARLSPKYREGENDKLITRDLVRYTATPATYRGFCRLMQDNGVPLPGDWWRDDSHGGVVYNVPGATAAPSAAPATLGNFGQAPAAEEPPKNAFICPVSASTAPSRPTTPPPTMSPAELADLNQRSDYIDAAREMIRDTKGLAPLMNLFGCVVSGIGTERGTWVLSPGQQDAAAAIL